MANVAFDKSGELPCLQAVEQTWAVALAWSCQQTVEASPAIAMAVHMAWPVA
jgi:hypothetical protein